MTKSNVIPIYWPIYKAAAKKPRKKSVTSVASVYSSLPAHLRTRAVAQENERKFAFQS